MALSVPLALRWQRAQQIDPSSIRLLGPYRFLVPSQHAETNYEVELEFAADGTLLAASCSCPDFTKSATRPNTPSLHGIRVCKHILAAALHATRLRLPTVAASTTQPSRAEAPPASVVTRPAPSVTQLRLEPPDTGLPTISEPVWDDVALEWHTHDADGWVYWGDSPAQCLDRYRAQMQRLAEHARKSGMSIAELRELNARERDHREQYLDERPY